MNVALLLLDVSDEFCGGAERFFSDFFDLYNSQSNPNNNLYFITDKNSYKVLNKIGKLNHPKKVILINELSNRFKKPVEGLEVISKIIKHRIDILHVASYGVQYYNRVKFIDSLPDFIRPRIIVNIVDPELAYTLVDKNLPKYQSDNERWKPLFNNIKISGIYSWYILFKEVAEKYHLIKSRPYMEAVKTRFTGIGSKLTPSTEKRNEIIFAARMVDNKQPIFFIEGIKILKQIATPEILSKWKIKMFGKGPLEALVRQKIEHYNLSDLVSIDAVPSMIGIINQSKCFVSTQDYENFPSQSMNEALAAGNAIVSRNVGQTHYFVREGLNGILMKQDTPQGLAEALKYYLEHPELHDSMEKESVRLTREVHTPENFIKDIDIFWKRFIK